MRAAAVTLDPAFQARVKQAKGTIVEISLSQLILDRESETMAKLQVALNPDSPDLHPFVRLIALRSGLEHDKFVRTTGQNQEIDNQFRLLVKDFFPSLDTSELSSNTRAWLKRCLFEGTIPAGDKEVLAVVHDPSFQDRLTQAKKTIRAILISESSGLSNIIEQAWLLIKDFFPLETYGLPSIGMWAWLLRCLLNETVQTPTPEDFPVFLTYDPENILAMAKLDALIRYCKKNGLDLKEFEQSYKTVEDRIIDLLDQRWFIELIPGTDLKKQVDHIRAVITDAYDAGGIDQHAHKIPNNFQNKLETILVPRQYCGASLEEIQDTLPEIKEISNISRDYHELIGKTGLTPVAPRQRGRERPH